jgi:hypothetical protein
VLVGRAATVDPQLADAPERRAQAGAHRDEGSVKPMRSSMAGPSTGSDPPIGRASSSSGSMDASTTSSSLHADQPAAVAIRTA